MTSINPVLAGIRCKCPQCGEGKVFAGFLKFADTCDNCSADFTIADAGDGPAFFVMFAALIFIAPTAMILELAMEPPFWVHAILWPPVILIFCVALLRPFKAILFALQWKHSAGEARFEDSPK